MRYYYDSIREPFISEYWINLKTVEEDTFNEQMIHSIGYRYKEAVKWQKDMYWNVPKKFIPDLIISNVAFLMARDQDELEQGITATHRIDTLLSRIAYPGYDIALISKRGFRPDMIDALVKRHDADPEFKYKLYNGKVYPTRGLPDDVRCYFDQHGNFTPDRFNARMKSLTTRRKTLNINKEAERLEKRHQLNEEKAERNNPTASNILRLLNPVFRDLRGITDQIPRLAILSFTNSLGVTGVNVNTCGYRASHYAGYQTIIDTLLSVNNKFTKQISTWKRDRYRTMGDFKNAMRAYLIFKRNKPMKKAFAKENPSVYQWLEKERLIYLKVKETK